MNAKKIQEIIDSYHPWDARVKSFECNYFADEVELIYSYDTEQDISYKFEECYRTNFDHVKDYKKFCPSREMTLAQNPYFIQEVEVTEVEESGINFLCCKINMFPLDVEVLCKNIHIVKIDISND